MKTPHPLSWEPHTPLSQRVRVGMHWHCPDTHCTPAQLFGFGHAPQLMAAPHVSVAEPHWMLWSPQLRCLHPQRPGVTAPQVFGAWHVPLQLSVPPQPSSSALPHCPA
mgnify:CR=1 FL=1